MTDKVQKIREEIEKRLKGERFISSDKEYNYLLSFIDSLQEEPVSEDLEEAAWLQYDRNKPLMPPELDLHKELIDFFKAGAEWSKKHQAEKDLELTWKDIEKVCLIAREVHQFRCFWSESVYQEVLERFREKKGKEL